MTPRFQRVRIDPNGVIYADGHSLNLYEAVFHSLSVDFDGRDGGCFFSEKSTSVTAKSHVETWDRAWNLPA
jgi:hypothetical protein